MNKTTSNKRPRNCGGDCRAIQRRPVTHAPWWSVDIAAAGGGCTESRRIRMGRGTGRVCEPGLIELNDGRTRWIRLRTPRSATLATEVSSSPRLDLAQLPGSSRGVFVKLVVKVAWIPLFLCASGRLNGADLKPNTVRAFNQYVQKAELRMNEGLKPGGSFLWIDTLSSAERAAVYARLHNGEIIVHPFAAGMDISGGMIHDWVGVAFIPNATLDGTVSQIQNYNAYARIYAPEVARSKILKQNGNDFKVSLWLQNKSIMTVVLGVEENVQYFRLNSSHEYSCAHSTRIVENPGTSAEREHPSTAGRSYLWRLNGYGWFLQTPEGVFIQFEAIALSRKIPWGLEWLIKPFVTRVPRDSLQFTLAHARASLESATRQTNEVDGANPPRSTLEILAAE